MIVTDPITLPIDEPCKLGSLPSSYVLPVSGLVDASNEDRLIPVLRAAAQTRDPIEILSRAAVASFAASHAAATLVPFINNLPPGDIKAVAQSAVTNPQVAPALADLSVTGRAAYAKFHTIAPRESLLLDKVMGHLRGWPGATQENVLFSIRGALDRAYMVARTLHQQEARGPLRWIAVTGEDDPPHRPVNVQTAPYPQYDFMVMVKDIPVETRFMIASDTNRIPPPPVVIPPPPPFGDTGPIDLPRKLPDDPQPSLPEGEVILFIHGHSSRLEESLDLVPWLLQVGRERGRPYTVVAMDLPCNGYSSMFDHTRVAPPEASQYTLRDRVAQVPILDFIEEFIVQFVEALDRQLNIKNRIAAVSGGSLGGNMGLRLGRRSDTWLRNIVAWSPACVWNSVANERNDPFKEKALSETRDRMMKESDEAPDRRREYFFRAFKESHNILGITILPPQPQMWYRDGWDPCKRLHIDGAHLERKEMYNTSFRCWHWRVAYEQLIFSHLDPTTPGGPPRYESIRSNMLLASGEKDDYPGTNIFDATRDIAKHMLHTPGHTLFLRNTGHSIHNERPQLLAREIVDFLAR